MNNHWPKLSFENAKDTYETLLRYTQLVGKVKLDKLPWINHSWHVTLRVSPHGLSTGTLAAGSQHFQIDFNFVDHRLDIISSTGKNAGFPLEDDLSVAHFYRQLIEELNRLDIQVSINPMPNEIADATPCDQDEDHHHYERSEIERFHRALLLSQDVFTLFRSEFKGKCSPAHYFWGASDLAVTRFSGRQAPKHPGGIPNLPDRVAIEAYSHEVSSAGFWPGSACFPQAAFYSYAYPEPDGFQNAQIEPAEAYYHKELGEYILPYEVVQTAENPEETLLSFLRSTYNAAAELADWDREALEGKSKTLKLKER